MRYLEVLAEAENFNDALQAGRMVIDPDNDESIGQWANWSHATRVALAFDASLQASCKELPTADQGTLWRAGQVVFVETLAAEGSSSCRHILDECGSRTQNPYAFRRALDQVITGISLGQGLDSALSAAVRFVSSEAENSVSLPVVRDTQFTTIMASLHKAMEAATCTSLVDFDSKRYAGQRAFIECLAARHIEPYTSFEDFLHRKQGTYAVIAAATDRFFRNLADCMPLDEAMLYSLRVMYPELEREDLAIKSIPMVGVTRQTIANLQRRVGENLADHSYQLQRICDRELAATAGDNGKHHGAVVYRATEQARSQLSDVYRKLREAHAALDELDRMPSLRQKDKEVARAEQLLLDAERDFNVWRVGRYDAEKQFQQLVEDLLIQTRVLDTSVCDQGANPTMLITEYPTEQMRDDLGLD